MNADPKITPEHLGRKAIVYLRQSSEGQVRNNLESQRLQYAMADRATALGFVVVETIDVDLGSSAAIGAAKREGFQRLLGSVASGEIGIVLARELSRLLRTDRDFCQLVELCQTFDTLIGDEQTIYDPSRMDDQLVLGIKATMSVAELKVLRMRLAAGKESKARRGELYPRLPPGYVWDLDHKLVKDPNVRVQEGIALVFAKFRETWSARGTFKWFQENAVQLPVTQASRGGVRLVFQLPRQGLITSILHNPIYAGAYVWGRTRTEFRWVDGRLCKRQGRLSAVENARVFLRDHHEGYIAWEAYEEHQRMMQRNDYRSDLDTTAGAARSGKGLLAGLLRCGRCGRKLHVRYWKTGSAARYVCHGSFTTDSGTCGLAFGGAAIDRRIEAEVLKVVTPLGVRASLGALDELDSAQDGRRKALQRQLEEMEYEASRAFEQYNAVDPRNRLVALELERRWNGKLTEVEGCRKTIAALDAERPTVSPRERAELLHLGENFESAWFHPKCPHELKKQIVRAVVEEVIVDEKPAGTLAVIMHWKGGSHTALTMQKPTRETQHRTSEEDVDVIRKMAVRYGDREIARVLNRLRRKTGKGLPWSQTAVRTARRSYGIEGREGTASDPDLLSQNAAARFTGTSDGTIKKLVDAGVLPMHQVVTFAPWEIKRSDLESPRIQKILENLRRTGRVLLEGDPMNSQPELFPSDRLETTE